MSPAFVLIFLAVLVLVAVWVVSTCREKPTRRRNSSGYRRQHTENPDYLPGTGGRGGL